MRPWLLLPLILAGCSPSPELITEPDSTRAGLDGDDGPFGAWWYEDRTLTRVDDLVRYRVIYPVDEAGEVPGGELPLVVMIHGGFVEVERYRWLGAHLATRGYVTLLADHDANLSLLTAGNSEAAWDDLASAGGPLSGHIGVGSPAAVLGHSLGGVAAASLWATSPERWGVLGILASFPAGDTDVEQFTGRPTLHLVGSEDEPEAKREQGFERFAEPRIFGVVEGMNHYDWTDDVSDSDRDKDAPHLRPTEESRRDAQHLLDTALDAWLRGDGDAAERLDGAFEGVEVSR